jgi:CSLREA domain-containing protein
MRAKIRKLVVMGSRLAVILAVLLATAALTGRLSEAGSRPSPFLPPPPPPGVALIVNTTSDLVDPGDGKCSLRAAITATNINGIAGNCDASLSGTGAIDGIIFDIGSGTPLINVSTALPEIKAPLSIAGDAGPGGSTRVELHGPGSGIGLQVSGSAAKDTTIRNMVINNFTVGIRISNTTNITVIGNYIGTNAGGTSAKPNSRGIELSSASARIGGTNGVTAGGPCTGECNLISGNTSHAISLAPGSTSTIQWQFHWHGHQRNVRTRQRRGWHPRNPLTERFARHRRRHGNRGGELNLREQERH